MSVDENEREFNLTVVGTQNGEANHHRQKGSQL